MPFSFENYANTGGKLLFQNCRIGLTEEPGVYILRGHIQAERFFIGENEELSFRSG